MKAHRLRSALILLLILALPTVALAQSGGGFDLSWNTVDGGGSTFLTGGSYTLSGTVGQPDAGAMSGGAFSLQGGFWAGATAPISLFYLYLPILVR